MFTAIRRASSLVSAWSMSRRTAMCARRPETHTQGDRKAKDQNAAEEQQKVIHALPPERRGISG